ncbi:MAG: hypothetical protein WManBPW_04750 [Shewanella algae]
MAWACQQLCAVYAGAGVAQVAAAQKQCCLTGQLKNAASAAFFVTYISGPLELEAYSRLGYSG